MNPDHVFHLPNLYTRTDTPFTAIAAPDDPDLISWKSQKDNSEAKLKSYIVLLALILVVMAVLAGFQRGYLDTFDKSSPFFEDDFSCNTEVSLHEAW